MLLFLLFFKRQDAKLNGKVNALKANNMVPICGHLEAIVVG
jgi:hypothetical protein